jgi:hypothetical protein
VLQGPFVFVVAPDGAIAAKFEGITVVLDSLLSP